MPDESSSDDEDHIDLLQQCIRTGMPKKVVNPECSDVKGGPQLPPQRIFKENAIGMLRQGGNSFIRDNFDEIDRFHIEDTPCNYSTVSGLSDLSIGSQKAGVLKVDRYDDK